MATEIYLTTKGEDIAPELWEQIYRESLVLLENFPAALTWRDVQEVRGENRYVYTPEIVCELDTPDEHWTVGGDLSSRQEAEEFDLYRYHSRQFPNADRDRERSDGRDVLWVPPDDKFNDIHGNGREIWYYKTQGRPYHFPMLAVGMLVESRCPRAAYVIGDIDRRQAEQAAAWANTLLEEPIDLPVCVDPDRLYLRAFEMYGDARPAYRRFVVLFRGAEDEVWPTIVRHTDPSSARGCLAESLRMLYGSGAADDAIRYLKATGDLAGLIETVAEIASGDDREPGDLTLESLLHTLCDGYSVTIPPEERCLVLRIDIHVTSDELLEHFSRVAPHRREQFRETIRKSEEHAREKSRQYEEVKDDRSWAKRFPELAQWSANRRSSPTEERPLRTQILDDISEQKLYYPDAEAQARETGATLREDILSTSAFEQVPDRDALLRALYRASYENYIMLTAPSWAKIDVLEDDDVLRHLLALASNQKWEMDFCDWRRYLLEEPRLWPALTGEGVRK